MISLPCRSGINTSGSVRLGNSGLKVSQIILGGSPFFVVPHAGINARSVCRLHDLRRSKLATLDVRREGDF